MGLRDRVRTMGFGLPDFGAMQSQLDDKFSELLAQLVAIRSLLQEILGELRTQRGAP